MNAAYDFTPARAEALARVRAKGLTNAAAAKKARTHCVHSHAFTPDNTLTDSRGYRRCRTCHNDHIHYLRLRKHLSAIAGMSA